MSELAKQARKANREKAERLTRTDPTTPVDASGYTPPGALNADVQTGPKPTGRQHRKTGGKVQGAHAKARADKSPRKGKMIGGSLGYLSPALMAIDALRGDKDKDQGPGLGPTAPRKSGGRTKKADGGSFVPTERFKFSQGPSQLSRSMGLKRGGKASVSDGEIEGTRPTGGRLARKEGGRSRRDTGGEVVNGREYFRSNAERSSSATEQQQNSDMTPISKVDAGRGALIPISRQSVHDYLNNNTNPNRTERDIAYVDRDGAVTRRQGRKAGGRASKGKMNVNIVIDTGKPDQAAPAPMMPHPPIPIPPPGAGLPPGGLGAGGPPMPPPGMMGAPQGMPPMPRKRGGRAAYPIDGGSLGGKARLEKAEAYGPKR